MTIYSLDVLLSWFGTSLLLLDLHTDFLGGRLGGLVFPSLSEFSTVCCDLKVKGFRIVNKVEVDVFTIFTYPNLAHPSRLNIYAISFKKSFLYLLCSLSSLNVYMYLFIFDICYGYLASPSSWTGDSASATVGCCESLSFLPSRLLIRFAPMVILQGHTSSLDFTLDIHPTFWSLGFLCILLK